MSEKKKKRLKMNKKTVFFSIFVNSSKLVDLQTLIFVYFQMCFLDFRCKTTEKGLKLTKKVENAKKSVSTNSRVGIAPDSWSKYTTYDFQI